MKVHATDTHPTIHSSIFLASCISSFLLSIHSCILLFVAFCVFPVFAFIDAGILKFCLHQRMREEMEEITQQQMVHDKYCKELMGFGTKPRHITPFTSFQSVQPPQSNALLGLLGYSTPQGFLSFGATPVPSKSTLVESRYCRELMEERFDQVISVVLNGCQILFFFWFSIGLFLGM